MKHQEDEALIGLPPSKRFKFFPKSNADVVPASLPAKKRLKSYENARNRAGPWPGLPAKKRVWAPHPLSPVRGANSGPECVVEKGDDVEVDDDDDDEGVRMLLWALQQVSPIKRPSCGPTEAATKNDDDVSSGGAHNGCVDDRSGGDVSKVVKKKKRGWAPRGPPSQAEEASFDLNVAVETDGDGDGADDVSGATKPARAQRSLALLGQATSPGPTGDVSEGGAGGEQASSGPTTGAAEKKDGGDDVSEAAVEEKPKKGRGGVGKVGATKKLAWAPRPLSPIVEREDDEVSSGGAKCADDSGANGRRLSAPQSVSPAGEANAAKHGAGKVSKKETTTKRAADAAEKQDDVSSRVPAAEAGKDDVSKAAAAETKEKKLLRAPQPPSPVEEAGPGTADADVTIGGDWAPHRPSSAEETDSIPAVAAKNDDDNSDGDDGVVCSVCQSTDGDPADPIVFCDGCDLTVHARCYGSPLSASIPDDDWFCQACLHNNRFHTNSTETVELCCCLCPTAGGALKPTVDDQWAHLVCALLVPEVFFKDPEGRNGVDCSQVPRRRWRNKCYLCGVCSVGCVVECSESKCELGFHVGCALEKGLCFEYKEGRGGNAVVAGFCKAHTELWKKQQVTGKYKIVARAEKEKI